MRQVLVIVLFFSFFLNFHDCFASNYSKDFFRTLEKNTSKTDTFNLGLKGNGLKFSSDSGFVMKKEGIKFLQSIFLIDTTSYSWTNLNENDTIGKYYSLSANGNYILCLIDLSPTFNFETHLIFEVKADGTVLKCERFFHGNYPCCWKNYYEGFFRSNNFFIFTSCGTGSGVCGSNIYVFKEIISQKSQNSIPLNLWVSDGEDNTYVQLRSEKLWENENLIIFYYLEKGKRNKKSTKFKAKSKDKFQIVYSMSNGIWKALDEKHLFKLQI
jgi:hypothetical protein